MSEISKQALKVDNSTSFPDNNTGYISPSILRAFNVNMIDSLVEQEGYTADSASWNISIGKLNDYTASFAPSLDALNSFTASQLTINTGLNQFTQSAGASITRLDTFSSSFNAYTSSINQIRSNGVTLGTSTIFNLVGPGTFFSASLVQNIQGNIATLTFTSDAAKLNTSSFNDYTASTAATQSVFSASVATSISSSNAAFTSFSASQNKFNTTATASIVQLLDFSASLDATYATDAQLNYSASVLQANINTKLNTASFNDYTQSFSSSVAAAVGGVNTRVDVLSSFTGSYATTGSNTFFGNQTVFGDYSAPGITVNGGFVTDAVGVYNQYSSIVQAANASRSGSQFPTHLILVDPVTYAQDGLFGGFQVQSLDEAGNPFSFIDVAANAYTPEFYPEVVGFVGGGGSNTNNSNTALVFRTGSADMLVYKPTTFNYPVTVTGSVIGNVSPLTITSNTASMDLSTGNFFTLNLVSGSTTHLTATNIKAGQTINLLLNQPAIGTGSVSYNSTFKFPSAGNYITTPVTSSTDIVTFITFNASTIYATAINNLV